jgi:MFS family permease
VEQMMMRRKQIILIVASTAIFFEALDIAILNLAIPLMQQQFHLEPESIQWVQTVYVLFYGGFLVIGGKLCDTIGRKKIFMSGAALFLFTSLGAGLSPNFIVLTVFRALQGLAAAMVMPSALSVITNTFTEPRERNRALSIFSSFAAIGSGCGLALGGIVATYLGWRWIFFINVPVITVALVLAYRFIDKDVVAGERRFPDIISGFLLTLIIVLISYVVHNLPGFSQHYKLLAGAVTIIIAGCYFFMRRERKQQEPLIDFSLFRSTGTITGNGITVLLGAFFLSYLFLLSLILQQNIHFSAAQAGLILFPFSMCSFIV